MHHLPNDRSDAHMKAPFDQLNFRQQPGMARSHEKASIAAYQRQQLQQKKEEELYLRMCSTVSKARRSSVQLANLLARHQLNTQKRRAPFFTPVKVESLDELSGTDGLDEVELLCGSDEDSKSDASSIERLFIDDPSYNQDYLKLKHLTLEKMVLTKRISKKQARKEKIAALNSKIHLNAHLKAKASQSYLHVEKNKSAMISRSQPKAGAYCCPTKSQLTPFFENKSCSGFQHRRSLYEKKQRFTMKP